MACASRVQGPSQTVIPRNIRLWFLAQSQSFWRGHIRLICGRAVHQPAEQIQHMRLGRHPRLQCHFHGTEHGLFIVLQNQGQDLDHLAIPARLAQHLSLQLAERLRHLDERGAVTQRPRLALDHGEVMAPVINDAARLPVGPFDDARMRADHVPFGHDHQPIGVDVQADGAVRKAGRHRSSDYVRR